MNQDCQNLAAFVENRGPRYCSNGCVLNHCRYLVVMEISEHAVLYLPSFLFYRKVFELYFSSQV